MRTPRVPAPVVTASRAHRLYQLLTLLAESPRTRTLLLKRLKIDVRNFYRDLELLRGLGVTVSNDSEKYRLEGELDDALASLPFPDPGLSVRDVLQLAQGRSDAHRRLRNRIVAVLGPNGKPG